ncbi:DUF362 domain-containing protein [Ammonifex thiophilus]|uniref:Ferredoxin n=1 Tax=Ammonifex thiophilus TaxID=444093 RepID=A0A3D8P808_9THEO|nr:4Fe-4S dicluster domain-containing protein [Ammonifex thiophilus]
MLLHSGRLPDVQSERSGRRSLTAAQKLLRKVLIKMMVVDQSRCSGCGTCLSACRRGAISLVEGVASIDPNKCVECQACLRVCPQGAIIATKEGSIPSSMEVRGRVAAPSSLPGVYGRCQRRRSRCRQHRRCRGW